MAKALEAQCPQQQSTGDYTVAQLELFTVQQLCDIRCRMVGLPTGKPHSSPFHTKAALIVEIRRLQQQRQVIRAEIQAEDLAAAGPVLESAQPSALPGWGPAQYAELHRSAGGGCAGEPVAERPVAEQPVAEQPVAEQPVAEQPVAVEQLVLPTTKEGVRLWRARLDAIDAAIDALAAAEAAQADAEVKRSAAALKAEQATAALNRLSTSLPLPESEDEDEASQDALIPYHHKKTAYLRWGHIDEDGEGVWEEGGDIWLQNADGSKGAYAGQLRSNGRIDNSAEVMATEPDIE